MFDALAGAKITKVRTVKGSHCSKRQVRVGKEPGEHKVPQTPICFNHTKLLKLTTPESPSSKPFLNCLQTRARTLDAQIYEASDSSSLPKHSRLSWTTDRGQICPESMGRPRWMFLKHRVLSQHCVPRILPIDLFKCHSYLYLWKFVLSQCTSKSGAHFLCVSRWERITNIPRTLAP